jgi:hypothetical protein
MFAQNSVADPPLPGVKVNVNAMVYQTQLEQEGYTMIYQ